MVWTLAIGWEGERRLLHIAIKFGRWCLSAKKASHIILVSTAHWLKWHMGHTACITNKFKCRKVTTNHMGTHDTLGHVTLQIDLSAKSSPCITLVTHHTGPCSTFGHTSNICKCIKATRHHTGPHITLGYMSNRLKCKKGTTHHIGPCITLGHMSNRLKCKNGPLVLLRLHITLGHTSNRLKYKKGHHASN